MGMRHTDIEFKNLRKAMDRSDDVLIGAYAKRVRRQRIWLGIFGALLVLGAGGIYYALTHSDGSGSGRGIVWLECRSCHHRFSLPVDSERSFPAKCPVCHKNAARLLRQCRDCGHIFLPRGGEFHWCPECQSYRVGNVEEVPEEMK